MQRNKVVSWGSVFSLSLYSYTVMGSKYLRSCIWISPQFLESLRNHFVWNRWSFGKLKCDLRHTLSLMHLVCYALYFRAVGTRGRVQDNPPPYILAGIYKQNLFLRTLETSPFRIFRPSYGPVSLLNWQNVDVFLHSCLGSGWIEGVTEQEKNRNKKIKTDLDI